MIHAIFKSLFVILLIGSVAGASVPADSIAEAAVVSAIDQQADSVFREFRKSHPQVSLSLLKQAQRSAVYRLKQMHVITDVLRASGPATASTIVATEVLTNFILAPIATAIGKPALGAALVAVPWGLITGFGVFSLQAWSVRFKVARGLGLRSLAPLDRIRDLVIGYDLKYRVSTIVYQSVASDLGDVRFEVLRKSMDFSNARVPAITVDELEGIVRSAANGPSYLEAIYNERLDNVFYSALLLRFIDSDSQSAGRLMDVIRSRLPTPDIKPMGDSRLRQHLIATADVRAKIDGEMKQAQSIRRGVKKRVKKGELHKDDGVMVKDHLDEELDRLRQLRAALNKHEYGVLQDAHEQMTGEKTVSDVDVATARSSALVQLALRARLDLEPITFPVLQLVPAIDVESLPNLTLAPMCSDLFAVAN